MSEGWHQQAIREANLLSYEAKGLDDGRIKVEGYGPMDKKEFENWLAQAKYIAGGHPRGR